MMTNQPDGGIAVPANGGQLLQGKVAVVAGATRGAGRGIACMLGAAGATVYCTGRSVRGRPATAGRPETIEGTAELVSARGGVGIHAQVDHTVEEQVKTLFERVEREQGRLDILVNDVWGGDELSEWGKPFWTLSPEKGLLMLERAIHSHIITSRYGVPLMIEGNAGLIVEITDGDDVINRNYRGNLFYDLVKISIIRLAYAMALELRDTQIAAVALTPGFLRSEAMLEHFGVSEKNWQDAVEQQPDFAHSETPYFVGRAVTALAADPLVKEKSGRALASWSLAKEYGFSDVDGRQPDMGGYIASEVAQRWAELVEVVERQFDTAGRDPALTFSHNRERLELRALLGGGATPSWFRYPLMHHELWMPGPTRLAVQFSRRYDEELARRTAGGGGSAELGNS